MKILFPISVKTPKLTVKTNIEIDCEISRQDILEFISLQGINSLKDYLLDLTSDSCLSEENLKSEMTIARNNNDYSDFFMYAEEAEKTEECEKMKLFLTAKYSNLVNNWVCVQVENLKFNDLSDVLRDLTY